MATSSAGADVGTNLIDGHECLYLRLAFDNKVPTSAPT